MEIIHIGPDQKFINSAYWQFEQVNPRQNRFYLLVEDPGASVKYVNLNEDFHFLLRDVDSIIAFAGSFESKKIFCFHGLDYYSGILLNELSTEHIIIWMLWGSEIYGNKRIVSPNEVLGPLTLRTIPRSKKKLIINSIKNAASYFPGIARLRKETSENVICNAIKRADYCGVLYSTELDLVKERIKTEAKFFKFFYFPIEQMLADTEAKVKSDNILIGNSATRTNNHLEIFQHIKSLPVNNRKLIVPLSYGDWDDSYTELVIRNGRELFGKNFQPLTNFMSLPAYNKFLEQCGIVIMNQYRQQAAGVIFTMLWMGAKIYLNGKNSIFKQLRTLGLHIYSIQEDLKQDNPQIFSLLSSAEQQNNRQILKDQISQEVLLPALGLEIKSLTTVKYS